MATRSDPMHDGRRLADQIRRELGTEIRSARLSSGLSQRSAGSAVGMSHAQFGRIEHGAISGLTVDQACRAGVAVGLRLSARMYPAGDPVRDSAQLRVLERLHRHLPSAAVWETEVPLPASGDLRAWDALIRLGGRRAGCEAETRLADVQALERRLALKLRDGSVDVLILVVSDTAHNRSVLAAYREALRPMLPLDGRDILRAFRRGELPGRNGLIVL